MECWMSIALSNINGSFTFYEKTILCSWLEFFSIEKSLLNTCFSIDFTVIVATFITLCLNSRSGNWRICCISFTWFTVLPNSPYVTNGSSWWYLEIIRFCCLCSSTSLFSYFSTKSNTKFLF